MTKSVSGSQQLVCAVKGGFKAEALSLSFHLACQGDSGVGRPSYNQKFLGPPQSARTWLNHKVIGWCCKSSRCIPGRIRSNPRMRITDMRGVCAIAHKSGLPSRAVPEFRQRACLARRKCHKCHCRPSTEVWHSRLRWQYHDASSDL